MKRKKAGRYPEIFIGLILIVAGVVFVFIFSGSDKEPGRDVAILVVPLQKDEVLEQKHLGTTRVSATSEIGLYSALEAASLFGQKAILNLPPNTPILPAHFSKARDVAPGNVLVGMRLGVGHYPLPNLRSGDLVDISDSSQESEELLLKGIRVYSAYQLSEGLGADMFITLSIPEFSEQAVASALSGGGIRLFYAPQSTSQPQEQG